MALTNRKYAKTKKRKAREIAAAAEEDKKDEEETANDKVIEGLEKLKKLATRKSYVDLSDRRKSDTVRCIAAVFYDLVSIADDSNNQQLIKDVMARLKVENPIKVNSTNAKRSLKRVQKRLERCRKKAQPELCHESIPSDCYESVDDDDSYDDESFDEEDNGESSIAKCGSIKSGKQSRSVKVMKSS